MRFMSNVHKAEAHPCSYQWIEPGSDSNLKLDQESENWSLVMGGCFVASFTLLGT